MWVYVCIYAHTHTHTAQMGYSFVSPGVTVGMRHLEGPKNPHGLNLGIHIFVHVYKIHMCIYMLGGRMKSWTKCFFLLHIFFLSNKKSKRCERKPPIISNLKYKI